MYLHEAHKTGKRYRRSGTTPYIIFNDITNRVINIVSALAGDWEVEPEVYEVQGHFGSVGGQPRHFVYILDNFNDSTTMDKTIGRRSEITIKMLD